MRRSRSAFLVLLLAAGSLPACGGPRPTARPLAPAASPSAAAAAHAGLTVSLRQTIPLGAGPIAGLTMWSHYLAWSRESGPAQVPQAIEVYDTAARSLRTVVASRDPEQVGGARGDGTMLSYTEVDPTDENRTTWSIHLYDLARNADRLIAKGDSATPLPLVPQPSLQGGCLAWGEPFSPAPKVLGVRLVLYDLATGARHEIAAARNVDRVTVDHGSVFFDADSAQGRDAYSTPCGGAGPVTALTSTGNVANPRASNGLLAWQEPVQGDPTSVWAQDDAAPGAPAIRLSDAMNQGNVFPGRGFVVWLDGDGHLTARDAGGRFPAAALPHQDRLSIAARWSVLGSTVAWVNAETPDGSRLTLYTADATAP